MPPPQNGPMVPHYWNFSITFRHTTPGKTPLDKWSFWFRNLNLIIHSTQKRQASMPPAGFEPTIPTSKRSQTHTLDRAVTGIGSFLYTRGTRINFRPCCRLSNWGFVDFSYPVGTKARVVLSDDPGPSFKALTQSAFTVVLPSNYADQTVSWPLLNVESAYSIICLRPGVFNHRGAGKSTARPGRKQTTFPAFYGTWRFITTFTNVHHLSLP